MEDLRQEAWHQSKASQGYNVKPWKDKQSHKRKDSQEGLAENGTSLLSSSGTKKAMLVGALWWKLLGELPDEGLNLSGNDHYLDGPLTGKCVSLEEALFSGILEKERCG